MRLGWPMANPRRKAASPAAFDRDCSATTFGSSSAAGTTDCPVKAT